MNIFTNNVKGLIVGLVSKISIVKLEFSWPMNKLVLPYREKFCIFSFLK